MHSTNSEVSVRRKNHSPEDSLEIDSDKSSTASIKSVNFLEAVEEINAKGTEGNSNSTFTITESNKELCNQNQNVEEKSRKKSKKWHRFLGLFLAMLSSMMFSINALIFKILSAYNPLTPAIWMFVGTAVLSLPFVIYRWWINANDFSKIDKKTFGILLARAFTGCSGMLLFFYSLQHMNIGDALVIACSSPIFVFLLAFLFLKESCGIVPVLTIILALIGVVIITRPPLLSGEESFKNDDLIGAALAFSSMLFIASTLVLMRYLQNVHHSLINLIFGCWGTLQTFCLALGIGLLKFPDEFSDAVLMTTTGLVFFIGQSFLAVALQLEEAGPVSLVRTSEVIFAFIWQITFLNIHPDVFSITGAILIMMGIITTILRKWIASLPQNHSIRERFAFVLK